MSSRVKHPSDSLRMWIGQQMFETYGLFKRVAPVEQFHLVLDSCVIQHDLRYLIRHSDRVKNQSLRTAIMETIDAGVVVAYVPPLALREIEKYLPKMIADVRGDADSARAIWNDYRERLIVVQPIRDHRHTELEQRDVNDLPFYAVFREASGEALLSADRHLLDTIEEATTAEEVTKLLREYTRQKAVALGASGQIYAGAVAMGYSGSIFVRAAKASIAAFKRLPLWAQLGLIAGGLWVASRPATKKWIADQATAFAAMAEVAVPRLAELVGDAAKAEHAAESVHSELRKRLKRSKRIGLRAALLRAARDAGVALHVRDLAGRVLALGYRTTARRFVEYIEGYLDRDPMFEKTYTGWRLRSPN